MVLRRDANDNGAHQTTRLVHDSRSIEYPKLHMLVGQDVRFEDKRNTAVDNHRGHSDIDHGDGFTLEDSC